MDRAGIICTTVSQVNQAAAENDDGTKIETDGRGTAGEDVKLLGALRRRKAVKKAEMTDLAASGLIVFLETLAVQKPGWFITAVFSF